jgi:cytochrome c peroxidase
MRLLYVVFLSFILAACGGSTSEAPEPAQPDPEQPDPEQPDPEQPDPEQPDPEQPDPEQPDPSALDVELSIVISHLGLLNFPLTGNTAPPASGPLFELGKELFFSRSLSEQFDVACASCHHPLLAGTDNLSLPVGVDAINPLLLGPGRTHDGERSTDVRANGGPNVARNSPTTFNIEFYDRTMFWDGRVEVVESNVVAHGSSQSIRTPDSLFKLPDPNAGNNLSEAQAKFPLTSSNEMFGHGPGQVLTNAAKRWIILQRLRDQGLQAGSLPRNEWLEHFKSAYSDASNDPAQVITMGRVAQALSVYQRSQILINNPWFNYLAGDIEAIPEPVKQGALLFLKSESEEGYACNSCHRGNNFTDENYYNLAIPQLGRGKNLFSFDTGRLRVTNEAADKYRFRTPTLLNTAITGPWGHSGAYTSLEGIIKHHLDIEQAVTDYDYSLLPIRQFDYVPDRSDLYQNLTNRALSVLKTSNEWREPVASAVNAEHVNLLASFLRSLTDPCAQSSQCLAPWIPDANSIDPDGLRLLASFGDFDDQINTHQPLIGGGGAEVIEDSNTLFTDITVSAGLNYELPVSDITDEIHVMAGGVTVGDYNGDGWLDFFVSHALQPGKLFKNKGDGTFADRTFLKLGLLNSRQLGALFFDADEDGDVDLLLSEDDAAENYSRLFINRGLLPFSASRDQKGISFNRFAHSFSMADYDSDGDLDLYTAHWGGPKNVQNPGYLWQKQSTGQFTDVSNILPQVPASPIDNVGDADVQFSANFADIDGDHDSDILLSGDFQTSQVLSNNSGIFQDITSSAISDENGMGGAVGDYDNDGDLDWFVTSIWNPLQVNDIKGYIGGESGNRLYNNDGAGNFTDNTTVAGVREGFWAWGTCFADFNNDGWLDIFHTNGMTDGRSITETIFPQFLDDPSRLFINNQDGSFTERSIEYGITHTGHGRGISCLDFDKDGDVDILIANNGSAPSLYRNNSRDATVASGYLSVRLIGSNKNSQGVGAKIWLESDGLNQYRELRLGSNYLSNDPVLAHFGLADKVKGDKLTIRWPDGTMQIMNDVSLNQHLVITKP